MKKGSRARKCHICGKIIGWSIPTKRLFGIQECRMEWKDYGGHDEKGYLCKQCAKGRKIIR